MHYSEFNVRISSRSDAGYLVKVDSPAGDDSAIINIDVGDVQNRVHQIGGTIRSAGTRETRMDVEPGLTPVEVGAKLYNTLFTEGIRSLYDQSCGEVLSQPGMGLRIKIHVDVENPELGAVAQLPWELAYKSLTKEYVALSRQTPIVRYVEVPQRLRPHVRENELRILVVISSPKDHAQLDLEKERSLIESSWADEINVHVDFLEHPTRQKLQDAVEDQHYHVLHFMGHGAFDEQKNCGALLIEDEDGNADPLDAQTVGVWLADVPSLRLIFLNACNTGKADDSEPFAGVANRLVLAGLPAVLAMQFPISDHAAIEFSRAFYSQLVKGKSVDEATTRGRKAVFLGKAGAMEWATPVLFMRAPDGRLFDNPESAAAETEAARADDFAADKASPAPVEPPPAPEPAPAPPRVNPHEMHAEDTPENTVTTLSIFMGVIFTLLAAFSAYRKEHVQDPQTLVLSVIAIGVIGVALCTAAGYVRLRDTANPRFSALLSANIGNFGLHFAMVVGPIVQVILGSKEWGDYPATLFVGITSSLIFAGMVYYQLRASAWVYTVATPLATFVIVGHMVSIARQFYLAEANKQEKLFNYWTTHHEAFAHLLFVTIGLCSIIIWATFLFAKHKHSTRTART